MILAMKRSKHGASFGAILEFTPILCQKVPDTFWHLLGVFVLEAGELEEVVIVHYFVVFREFKAAAFHGSADVLKVSNSTFWIGFFDGGIELLIPLGYKLSPVIEGAVNQNLGTSSESPAQRFKEKLIHLPRQYVKRIRRKNQIKACPRKFIFSQFKSNRPLDAFHLGFPQPKAHPQMVSSQLRNMPLQLRKMRRQKNSVLTCPPTELKKPAVIWRNDRLESTQNVLLVSIRRS